MVQKMVKVVACVALVVAVLGGGQARADMIIDTTGWTPKTVVAPFGEPDTATYGQVFTPVAPHTLLTDFTFYLDDSSDPDAVDFAAYVMAWDGAKATGSVLFESAPLSTTNNGGAGGLEEFTIDTGGLALDAGQKYVAFFCASKFFDGVNGRASSQLVDNAAYGGGRFAYLNNGGDFSRLTADNWTQPDRDFSFKMTLAVIPEPATMSLLALGGLGLVARRRRKR